MLNNYVIMSTDTQIKFVKFFKVIQEIRKRK